jgi:hypothetical protein
MPRARRSGAVATEIEELVESFGVPLPTAAVRVLLADRGRPTSAEHLARVAAGERAALLRTGAAPRLCAAVAPDGARITPRWWARGDWRPLRRIRTADAEPLWSGKLAEGICADLIARRRPASPELAALVHATMASLGLGDELARLPDPGDWADVRALLLDHDPDAVFAHEVTTPQQREAQDALLAADLSAAARYFGS